MKARKKWAMVLMTILFVFLTMEVFLPGLLHAGGLDPMDPPDPTMHTLGEIYDKLETIEGKLPPVHRV